MYIPNKPPLGIGLVRIQKMKQDCLVLTHDSQSELFCVSLLLGLLLTFVFH